MHNMGKHRDNHSLLQTCKTSRSTKRHQQNKTESNICPHKSLMQYLRVRKHDSPSQALLSFMVGVSISRKIFHRTTGELYLFVILISSVQNLLFQNRCCHRCSCLTFFQKSTFKTQGNETQMLFKGFFRNILTLSAVSDTGYGHLSSVQGR